MKKNQQSIWNTIHEGPKADNYFAKQDPSAFAHKVQQFLPKSAHLLELGCGTGWDSFYFASQGHQVLATDFSEQALERSQSHLMHPNLSFRLLNISDPMPFSNETFDALYARLSLHYFTDQITKQIFTELHRVLKPNGVLAFVCKSVEDPLYGKGEELEKDMFVLDGKVRHFLASNI